MATLEDLIHRLNCFHLPGEQPTHMQSYISPGMLILFVYYFVEPTSDSYIFHQGSKLLKSLTYTLK